MAGTARLLLGPTAATGSSTNQTLYTAGTNLLGVVRLITVANTTGSAVTYRLSMNGTSATAANCLIFDKSLAANTTDFIYGPFVCKAAATIQAAASVAGVTFTVQGDETVIPN